MVRILIVCISYIVLGVNIAFAQSSNSPKKEIVWNEIFENGDMTIAYRSDIQTNKKGNHIIWVKVDYHTPSDQLYFAKLIGIKTPVATTRTKAEYSFNYEKVLVRQVMCYSKHEKLLYNSGDNTAAGWGFTNVDDPLSVVAVYLFNKANNDY